MMPIGCLQLFTVYLEKHLNGAWDSFGKKCGPQESLAGSKKNIFVLGSYELLAMLGG